jgi:hypothetical protein
MGLICGRRTRQHHVTGEIIDPSGLAYVVA